MKSSAILDANVLYPQALRDLFLSLAEAKLFMPKWSNLIMEEWTRNVILNHPHITPDKLARTCSLMDEHFPDASVMGFEWRIPKINLPDTDDCHVLAAAIHSRTPTIVTMNLRDFPKDYLSKFGIWAVHPDDFILRFVQFLRHRETCSAIAKMRSRLKNPAVSAEQLLDSLTRSSLRKTAIALSQFIGHI